MPQNLTQIIARLREQLDPDKVILFGSQATGTARDDSDIDLLIVAQTKLNAVKRFALVSKMLRDFPVAFDIVFKTPSEYEESRRRINTIVYFADKYGKVVYER